MLLNYNQLFGAPSEDAAKYFASAVNLNSLPWIPHDSQLITEFVWHEELFLE